MAYAFTATATPQSTVLGEQRQVVVTIVEADAAAASEWSVTLPWRLGTIVSYKATLATGTSTGTTINPALGRATGWTASTQDDIATNDTTAAHINDQTHLGFQLSAGNVLYGVSTVDAGTDNDITTEIVIVEGVI